MVRQCGVHVGGKGKREQKKGLRRSPALKLILATQTWSWWGVRHVSWRRCCAVCIYLAHWGLFRDLSVLYCMIYRALDPQDEYGGSDAQADGGRGRKPVDLLSNIFYCKYFPWNESWIEYASNADAVEGRVNKCRTTECIRGVMVTASVMYLQRVMVQGPRNLWPGAIPAQRSGGLLIITYYACIPRFHHTQQPVVR